MSKLPTGTLTFLFTDVEGSTHFWEQQPEAMRAACQRHDAIVEYCVQGYDGTLVRPRGEGDRRFAVGGLHRGLGRHFHFGGSTAIIRTGDRSGESAALNVCTEPIIERCLLWER